jgi:hypothetical protein
MVTPVNSTSPVLDTVIRQKAVFPDGIETLDNQGPAPPARQSVEIADPHTCLRMEIAGILTAGMVTIEMGDTTGVVEPGGVPLAVAVLTIEPAVRSA